MKSIKKYAWFLEIFSIVIIIPSTVIFSISMWFDDISGFDKFHKFWASFSYTYETNTAAMPVLSRILAVAIDGVSLGLFLWGLFCFIKVLRCYRSGEIFTLKIFSLFKKMSRIAFAWAVYAPIKYMLISIVSTLHNPVGQRVISVRISSDDIINIFVVGFFLIITSIIHKGFLLKNEQDLTV